MVAPCRLSPAEGNQLVLRIPRGTEVNLLQKAMPSTSQVVVKNPGILGGTPVFSGTRVPFQTLLDYVEAGDTLDDFLRDFPSVTREQAIAALEAAKTLLVDALG